MIRKKLILLIVFLLFYGWNTSTAQTKIQYEDSKKLTWDDFKGRPQKKYAGAALTHGTISLDIASKNDSLEITVMCLFDKKQSWVKKGKETDYLLAHEQLHFDIFELYARMMIDSLNSVKDYSYSNAQDRLNGIFKKFYNDCSKVQTDYDEETNHSIIEEKQSEWNKDILRRLSATTCKSGRKFKVPIKQE